MPEQAIKDRTAIVGVGATEFSKHSNTSVLNLAAEASVKAMADAGVTPQDIDGVVTNIYAITAGEKAYPREVIEALGLENCAYEAFLNAGGGENCSAVATAAMAIFAGLCNTVLFYFAKNGRTDRNAGQSSLPFYKQWELAYGGRHAATNFGKPVVAHMAKYGTTSLDMAHVAVTTRKHAILNTKAMMRTPLSVEQHQESPILVHPFHLFDFCLESDGAIAFVLTSAERAVDMRQAPVYIMGVAGGFHRSLPKWTTAAAKTAPRLYEGAGITPSDVDFAELYDNFTGMCLLHIEGFGLTGPGEAGDWVRRGQSGLDGSVPVNTHGGLLSEAHFQGINHILETVQQLRPSGVTDDLCTDHHDYDRARCRQVRDPQIGLVCGVGGASAMLLRRA